MKLDIVSPHDILYSGKNITLVQFPGESGSFEIMKNHIPMVAVLKSGIIKVVSENKKTPIFVPTHGRGVMELRNNIITVLVEQ